jgi:hypothetical protein
MLKKLLILVSVSLLLFGFGGCSKKDNNNVSSLKIDSKLDNVTLKDQFDKPHSITIDTKKVIFVFQKATGHTTKEYLNKQDVNYLSSRDIIFIADVSPMPSLIKKYVAIPDLQKHKYPILLINDEKISNLYKDSKNEDKIVVVELDKFKITKVSYALTEDELKKLID